MASSISLEKKLKEQEANKPKAFTYNKQKPVYSFTEKKPVYSYDDTQLKQYYDKLLNREDFSFDINGNALFNQYKDFYQKQGQMAMMDTMGQASALTGGYGNSYATSAGQQAYQQNLDQLNQVVPELYQLALQQYQMEGENLQNTYGILADDRDFAYNKYLGDVDIWQGNRDFAYQQYRGETEDYYSDRDFAYGQYRDSVDDYYTNRDYLYGQYVDQRDYEHTLERDKVADQQWQKEYSLKVQEFSESIRQFNKQYELSEKEFNEMCRQFALEYNLDVQQFQEDVRQYNETMSFNKEQAAISNSQWQQSFNETVRQNDISNNQWQQSFNETKNQNAISNSQWQQSFDETVRQNDISNSQWDKQYDYNTQQNYADGIVNNTETSGYINDMLGVVNSTFKEGGKAQTSNSQKQTTVEDFEITQTDEFFLNRFSKMMNEYGIDANDNVAILEMLKDPALGLSNEEVRKYYYALTS